MLDFPRHRSTTTLKVRGFSVGRFAAVCLLAFSWLGAPGTQIVEAQQRSISFPGDNYFAGFASYYRGDLRDAAKIFDRSRQTGYRGATGRWVDSICYHTMIGECLYQLGEIDDALVQYDNALSYLLADPDWMRRIDFQNQQIGPIDVARTRITWGQPTRAAGNFPDTLSAILGNDGQQALQQGGVFQRPELRQFNAAEIARCTTLAIMRRNEILGPLGKHDKMVGNLITALRRTQGGANHWGQAWATIPMAMALRGQGELDQAGALLQNAALISGQYHPLSSYALLELGKVRLLQNKPNDAAAFFLEATYPAAIYDQQDILEEAFRWGTTNHLVSKQGGVYAPLDPAATWARTRGSQQLRASLPLLAASCSLESGDSKTAAGLINTSKRFFGRTDLARSPWAARLAYAQAHAAFQNGDVVNGVSNLATSMQLLRNSGIWMFRLALVDQYYSKKLISDRVADDLYTLLLREPTAADWLIDPMETLSLILTPHAGPYERWMEIAFKRQEFDRAIEISDQLRRHRFYSSLPLGGRAMSMRWTISAPDAALDKDLVAERQKLLLRFPTLVDLQRKSIEVEAALRELDVNPDDASPDRQEQKKLLEQLGTIATAQEAVIGDLSLRREHSRFIFPPATTVPQIQEKLGPRQLVWMFVETSRGVYSCMITKGEYAMKVVPEVKGVRGGLSKLYRDLGIYDRNTTLDAETLASEDWHESIVELREMVASGRNAAFWENYDEIIVIPDGILWYLPFEMLPIGDDATDPLIAHTKLRYAPTLGTALAPKEEANAERPLGVVVGRLFPKDEPAVAQAQFDLLAADLPGTVKFETKLPGPSALIAGLCQTVLVYDDLDDRSNELYGWAPMQLDQGQAGSSVGNWMQLPWNSPAHLVLPGFHTAAERGLQKSSANGHEIFATVCGLMASGTETVVLSRWRMAGLSSYELTSEFVRELPESSASTSWQRSVELIREAALDPSQEPRLKEDRAEYPKTMDHPVFWAGYLVADRGSRTAVEAPEEEVEE